MMLDIAMHLLELIMNSIAAQADEIIIRLVSSNEQLHLWVIDNGKGMSEEEVKRVTSPFSTSRTTRKVGLGVSFMQGLADLTGGTMTVSSILHQGTTIEVILPRHHWDLVPLGDLGEMMMLAIQHQDQIHYILEVQTETQQFIFDSHTIQQELEGVALSEPEVLIWIREYIQQETSFAKGEFE